MLVETAGTRQTVAAACHSARSRGIRPGITLTEARALCIDLLHAPYEPHRDLRALEALGQWMMRRFSPIVALEPPDALFMDVGGCQRLFGGIEPIARRVAESFQAFRIDAGIAVAPTASGAWAVAASCNKGYRMISDAQLQSALAPLPPEMLRIDSDAAIALHQVGIATIGQLMALPRKVLPSRFGNDLLLRIDQALGIAHEPLIALEHRAPIGARMEFDCPIDSLETIWVVFKNLIDRVIPELIRRGAGARRMEVGFVQPYATRIEKTISISQPSRQPAHLFNLLRLATESVRADEGFTEIELKIPVYERLANEQALMMGQGKLAAGKELAQLIERLRARLGEGAAEQAQLVESHLPERAYACAEATANRNATGTAIVSAARPLCLLPMPVEIAVVVSPAEDREGGRPILFTRQRESHRLIISVGPERISGIWWDGHYKTRDYFDVEDETGQRFWIFRVLETWKWYLHGIFE